MSYCTLRRIVIEELTIYLVNVRYRCRVCDRTDEIARLNYKKPGVDVVRLHATFWAAAVCFNVVTVLQCDINFGWMCMKLSGTTSAELSQMLMNVCRFYSTCLRTFGYPLVYVKWRFIKQQTGVYLNITSRVQNKPTKLVKNVLCCLGYPTLQSIQSLTLKFF